MPDTEVRVKSSVSEDVFSINRGGGATGASPDRTYGVAYHQFDVATLSKALVPVTLRLHDPYVECVLARSDHLLASWNHRRPVYGGSDAVNSGPTAYMKRGLPAVLFEIYDRPTQRTNRAPNWFDPKTDLSSKDTREVLRDWVFRLAATTKVSDPDS